MKRNKLTLNESEIFNIVLNSVRRILREGWRDYDPTDDMDDDDLPDEFDDDGIDWIDAPQQNANNKNYFIDNGLVKIYSKPGLEVYLTATFLANRKIAMKIGGRWKTAANRDVFKSFIRNGGILVVVNWDGVSSEILYRRNGPVAAKDTFDAPLDVQEFAEINSRVMTGFSKYLSTTQKMVAEEDRFFAQKGNGGY